MVEETTSNAEQEAPDSVDEPQQIELEATTGPKVFTVESK